MEEKNPEPTSQTTDSINVSVTPPEPEIKIEVPKITPEDEKIIQDFKNIKPNLEDLVTLANNMIKINHELKSLKNIIFFMTEENIEILKQLNARDNIKINLLLSKIYINLISNESLYNNYLVDVNEEKLNIIVQIIDECIILIQKLNGFVFDPELFKFKEKVLSLIKCIYFNRKKKLLI